jgi:hypothetical protein
VGEKERIRSGNMFTTGEMIESEVGEKEMDKLQ